ncbi:MAG: ABC transporter permease subunit [Gemmiger sp.]|uniref:ABC transporter permease n=1 Tax=Gemmiger sp. TaxID=2049027 RepID=UPI002E7A5D8E|nr:ABC transporter permease subunit [Gemmiger sp.]MEE0800716.1 ABC transporter permease subunit [Gemmiger sp.]
MKMTQNRAAAVKPAAAGRMLGNRRWKRLKESLPWLALLFPAILVVFLFNYLPIYGVLIAFQDFMPGDPILSPLTRWIGFDNFVRFFNDVQFWPLMSNTFLLCIFGFIIGFPLPIIVALALNALKSKRMGKVLQTIFTAPHFISLVVLVGMLTLFFGRYGLVNNIAASLGGERISYFLESGAFRPMYILSSNWQDFGWSAIIYIAALSNVDPGQHEAAILDGATRFQRILYVDLPAIMPMVSVMLIMSIGGLMGVGYEKALLMQTDGNLGVSELIATYVYKQGLTGIPDQGYATAIGLFNSVINVVLLFIANTTSKRFSENSLF